MKTLIDQVHYPKIEVDHSENDIIQLWQSGKEDSNVIQIEREKVKELSSLINPIRPLLRSHLSDITAEDALKVAEIYKDGIVPEWDNERKIEFGKKIATCISGRISNLPIYNLNQLALVVVYLQEKYFIPNN